MNNGWLPIESAPKDGTKIDVWHVNERVTDVYWSEIQDAWCFDGFFGPEEPTPISSLPAPTHWQPLPAPPSS